MSARVPFGHPAVTRRAAVQAGAVGLLGLGMGELKLLRAAANPPHTSYLYFVEVRPSGQLGYASTTAGFDQLQQQCRAAHLC